jgi:hypothetical protein
MAYDYETSLPAYQEGVQGKDYCRQVVLLTIRKLGVCNDRQISEHLGWPINRITPRRGELVDSGQIIRAKRDIDPVTNRTVNWWQVTRPWMQLSLF